MIRPIPPLFRGFSVFPLPVRRGQMRARLLQVAFSCLFSFAASILAANSVISDTGEMEVEMLAREFAPGEIVLFSVRTSAALSSLRVEALNRSFSGYPTQDGRWYVLVGVDLETSPGRYRARVVGVLPSGERVQAEKWLEVQPKEFPTRRLTVEPRFVSPPESELQRIREESAVVSRLFARQTPERLWEGAFLRPVPGTETSGFGRRSVFNEQPRSPHTGADFRAAEGTPVASPNAGIVILVRDLYYAGNTVMIDHGMGLISYFAHLSRFEVSEDQSVKAGDVIGRVGATGRVTGPHLHWTLRLNETRIDPVSLLEVLRKPEREELQ
ncbi:MAG TPA: M23 family metallopeptidase [Acidobacteriota bacterium]|nr:M23 family metallopeptidase [Acidobacteriota bacterium]